ncbi:DUF6886 family protein, partial [Pantoea ananatis]
HNVTCFDYEVMISPLFRWPDLVFHFTRTEVIPTGMKVISNLDAELALRNITLRVMERLTPLKSVWLTTLHASGIRLRNAQDWGKPGWTHSKPGRQVIL